ncbi:MAG: helix-turn-helix domain-containing protein [Actinomycetota bacterium]|nr:helix-turn-helix domain-containing protein [Actinomycetota bacterium]
MSLGKRLKKMRIAGGLTQAELAAPNYTHAYVSSIEAGRRRPSAAAIAHFASKLGVDEDELATGRPADLVARLQIRLQEARRKVSTGDFDDAIADYAQVARDAKRYGLARLVAKADQGRALCAERSGDIEGAIDLYEQAEEELRDESPIARADVIAGKARCLQMLGDTRYAAYLMESLLVSLEHMRLQDPDALVRIHASLVAAYFELGLYEKAASSADVALRYAGRAKDLEGRANMHINAARVLLHQRRHEEAEDSLRRAEQLYRELDLRSETGSAYLAQGYIAARQDRIEEAREKLQLAISFFQDYPNPVDEATATNELARLERIDGNVSTAQDLLNRSIELLQDRDVAELALAHRELGLCLAGSDAAKAEKSLRHAIELYERASETVQLPATYRALGDLLTDQGDARGGCEAYRTGILVLEGGL